MKKQYHVTLLDKSLKTDAEAKIAIVRSPQSETGAVIAVVSNNSKMKAHIEKLLSTEYFAMSPGKNDKNSATVCVVNLMPDTMEYFEMLPEILGWRGYDAVLSEDIHKSFLDDIDLGDFVVFKSTDIYQNAKGERIVKYVPQGMIAISQDGRTVPGGKFLNANIDKDGAMWHLEENPYENMQPQERDNARADTEYGFAEYHPGMDNDAYNKRHDEATEDEYHTASQPYKPKGKTLKEHYGNTYQEATAAPKPAQEPQEDVPAHLPSKLEEGKVIYAPAMGIALDSKFWPPTSIEDWADQEWYIFDYAEGDDDELDSLKQFFGERPEFLKEARNGLIQVDGDALDTSSGVKMQLAVTPSLFANAEALASTIIINEPIKETFDVNDLGSSEMMAKVGEVRTRLKQFKDLTAVRTDDGLSINEEALDALKLTDLRGMYANFALTPYHYQKAVIAALVEPSQYEKFGGPRGYHGHYLNLKYGLGKTAIVCAAEAIMRNRGHLKAGTQATMITAPTKNIYVWEDEIGKFRNEGATVIDGSKAERIEQWENLLARAAEGSLPNFIVVAGSKFRLQAETQEDFESDEDVQRELELDAKYMKLMALGGSSNGKPVKGGHIGLMVLDETANYVNPNSSRFKAVREIGEAIYYGNGLIWTLNGDLSGNSAADTISEASFINQYAREGYDTLVQEYTKKDPARPNSDARIWNLQSRGLTQFNQRFGHAIYSLDGETVANEKYGLQYTPDVVAPLGRNWGQIYNEAMEKMEVIASMKKGIKAMGMLSILINASLGSVAPQRLLEYDLGTDLIMNEMKRLLDPEGYEDFKEELRKYLMSTTEEDVAYGRMPKDRLPISQRDESYKKVFSEQSRVAMDRATELWDNPVLDMIADSMRDTMKSTKPGSPVKLGLAGFSKRAIQQMYKKLTNEYNEDKVLVMKFDGDTDGKVIKDQQQFHQEEKDRHVISLVTGAGLYGLSLAANRGFRFPTWNPGKGGQFEGRFHRNPYQEHLMTVSIPGGVCEYMRELEHRKRGIQDQARAELLDIGMDDDGEISAKSGNVGSLIDKLKYYRPRILSEESGGAK